MHWKPGGGLAFSKQHIILQPSGHFKLPVHHPDLMAAVTKEEASPSYHLLSLTKNTISKVLLNQLISTKFITLTMLYEFIASLLQNGCLC